MVKYSELINLLTSKSIPYTTKKDMFGGILTMFKERDGSPITISSINDDVIGIITPHKYVFVGDHHVLREVDGFILVVMEEYIEGMLKL